MAVGNNDLSHLTTIEDLENAEFDESSIDFSDIEAKFAVNVPTGFAHVIVVDNVPIVDQAKEEKLFRVIAKLFKEAGAIQPDGIHMPRDPKTGMSKGYLFIEFETPESADKAVVLFSGHRFDKTHTFSVAKFDSVETYTSIPDEFVAPAEETFEPKEHLLSWLTDPRARDQFAMVKGEEVGVYWNNKAEVPDRAEARTHWTDAYVAWSPLGRYLVTVHKQGIAIWGGQSWKKIMRFSHPNVKLVDFSPNELYLVTWSHEPFVTPDGQHHHLAVWDIESGERLRTFPTDPSTMPQPEAQRGGVAGPVRFGWPIFKWSFDSKFIARMTPGAQGAISIYEVPGMGLLDKKSIKIENLQHFEWSPTEHIISYWTPESGNIPARVTLIRIPTREIVRTKNLFGVIDCKLAWQSAGEFLLVRVDRLKSKKQTVTSFEIFRMREKDIPVDVVEHKAGEDISTISWEPSGARFAILGAEAQKTSVSFYQVQPPSTSSANTGTKLLKTQETKGINTVSWSPKGRFCVLAGIRGMQGDLQFWDLDDQSIMATGEHYTCTDIDWDPTGRYVVTSVSAWRAQSDTGFIMWTFTGQQLTKQNVLGFKQFVWRPRPPTLLTPAMQKKIRKNLKDYSKDFELQDAAETNKASQEVQEKRFSQIREWRDFLADNQAKYDQDRTERIKLYGFDPDAKRNAQDIEELEEWIEEIVDETEEVYRGD
ncbi:Translation initiation factor 3 subunit b [Polyrhizophydium stewartii]|uniref:Eukaryotic translation initiation factor 3 subunit B n=1 Tax=Polyrhizophydium stewartii TaxID=2732419 RepID=A0ABR4NDI0_9FUNG|nr:Translation initiation factor 3 subunit b [Polyrhizophydium stewartii]